MLNPGQQPLSFLPFIQSRINEDFPIDGFSFFFLFDLIFLQHVILSLLILDASLNLTEMSKKAQEINRETKYRVFIRC